MTNIVTPVKVDLLKQWLVESSYDEKLTQYLVTGFTDGFDLEYQGPWDRRDTSSNIPLLHHIGTELDLWNKMMKEIENKRFAGPFAEPPFDNFVQSPVGLVPKAGGQSRLIFHLSYDFKGGFQSINHYIPKEKCSVWYNDLDHAIKNCIDLMRTAGIQNSQIWFSISDLRSAFRLVPLCRKCWKLLLMRVRHPHSRRWFYFVDKCLPFGASISCALFQVFSNALAHITRYKLVQKKLTNMAISNYLDDFLKISIQKQICEVMTEMFHAVCASLCIPLAQDKIIRACTRIVFLGILLDGERHFLAIPVEKRDKAVYNLKVMVDRKKVTVKEVQQLTGLLNFLSRAIYPGRSFTRRMYAKITCKTAQLRQHHHINLDAEFRADCQMWLKFLSLSEFDHTVLYRPFVDLSDYLVARDVGFFTDSSANPELGFGGVFRNKWFFGQWEKGFIKNKKPNIEYLELYAVCIGLFVWADAFLNTRLLIHCDNQAVVAMINNTTSNCKHCMILIRSLVLKSMECNFRVFARYIRSSENDRADSLSRHQFDRFFRLSKGRHQKHPENLPIELWPTSKIWNDNPNLGYDTC